MSQKMYFKTCLVVANVASKIFLHVQFHVRGYAVFSKIKLRTKVAKHFVRFQVNRFDVIFQMTPGCRRFSAETASVGFHWSYTIVTFLGKRICWFAASSFRVWIITIAKFQTYNIVWKAIKNVIKKMPQVVIVCDLHVTLYSFIG